MQNMRIGITTAIVPVGVKSNSPDRCPSWKIHTMAPNVAVRLRMLRTTAFSGTSKLPNSRNSTTNVVTTMMPAASGMLENSESFESTSSADGPPTRAGAGAGTARTAWTTASPSADIGSTDGTTDSQVAPGATNRAAAGPAGATWLPPA